MGTKRVGLARTQALLEGLNRELAMGTSQISCGTVTASNGLTASAGGLTVTAGGITVDAGDVAVSDGKLQVNKLSTLSLFGKAKGTDLADDTAAITLTSSSAGKTFLCLLDGAAKTVNLPANHTEVGTRIRILQTVDLVGSGVLTINAHTSNTFCTNSYAVGRAVTGTRPADANNRCVITGAASNSAFGAGSYVDCVLVEANEWMIMIHCNELGNGSDAVAFSTV